MEAEAEVLRFDGLTLDLAGRTLATAGGQEIPLSRGEFTLLTTLIASRGRVLSRDQLLDAIAGRRAEPFDRTIDVMISRLRRKIEPEPKTPRLILTAAGFGYKFVAKVRPAATAALLEPESGPTPPEPTRALPERRYVTALVAELLPAEGTVLPGDPEELFVLVDAYRRAAAAVIVGHGGVIADSRGREVLAYFGYPVAQEYAAERALQAALMLAEHRAEGEAVLPAGLAVRVGMTSGLVVTNPAGEVLGEAPGEATRLLTLAEPGDVVIDDGTRRLAGGLFTYREPKPFAVKGIAGPVRGWQVRGASALGSRSEALYAGALLPLVGRDEELALLLRAWREAKSGEGHLVLLSGEPGIGKSRLLAALEAELAAESHVSLRYFCSPLHQDNALYPLIARWEQEAGFVRGDSAEARLRKVELLLTPAGLPPEDAALIAAMLSVPTGERYPHLDLSPRRRKERTFAALLLRLERIARSEPALMLFEDAHWADPSSLEFLDRLVDRMAELPILLVISFRPEFAAPWIDRAGVSLIGLSRLNRRQSATLAAELTTGSVCEPALLERIVTQSDGVPLFIEELTKAALESAEIDAAVPIPSRSALPLPATLHASLLARLDRLGASAKEVAQIGAAIGREFSYELFTVVADRSDPPLQATLDRLVGAGLIFRRGLPPEATFHFKHALVQDAAYSTLLRSHRRQLHARIVQALEQRFPEKVKLEPGLIAHHCEQAGLIEPAIRYWLKAGDLALSRSAMAEAIGQLSKGLAALSLLPDGSQRRQLEINLQLTLGAAQDAAKGWASAEMGQAYARARDLCAQDPSMPQLFSALTGLWQFHINRAEHEVALRVAEDALRLAEGQRDGWNLALAHRLLGGCLIFRARFCAALAHLDTALSLVAAAGPRREAFGSSSNARVPAFNFSAWALLFQGFPDRARQRSRASFEAAQANPHPLLLAYALHVSCVFHQILGDWQTVRQRATMLVSVAREQGFPHFLGTGTFFLSWADMFGGCISLETGIAGMREGLAAKRATGAEIKVPYYLGLIADTERRAGRPEVALELLAEAVAQAAKTGERWIEAELHRYRGMALAQQADCLPDAEKALARACKLAQDQAARLWELRAATSLARLRCDRGEPMGARDLLAPVYAWFTEGFDTPDLREARSLLDDLAGSRFGAAPPTLGTRARRRMTS